MTRDIPTALVSSQCSFIMSSSVFFAMLRGTNCATRHPRRVLARATLSSAGKRGHAGHAQARQPRRWSGDGLPAKDSRGPDRRVPARGRGRDGTGRSNRRGRRGSTRPAREKAPSATASERRSSRGRELRAQTGCEWVVGRTEATPAKKPLQSFSMSYGGRRIAPPNLQTGMMQKASTTIAVLQRRRGGARGRACTRISSEPRIPCAGESRGLRSLERED